MVYGEGDLNRRRDIQVSFVVLIHLPNRGGDLRCHECHVCGQVWPGVCVYHWTFIEVVPYIESAAPHASRVVFDKVLLCLGERGET